VSSYDILIPYRGIPEKTNNIQELLKEGKVYLTFKKAISEKNFKMAFKLLNQYGFLKEFPEYTAMTNYADKLYIQVQKYIMENDTSSALKTLRMLSEFSDFEEEANQLREDIENRLKFDKAIQLDDISLAYSLLDNSDDLQETQEGEKLQRVWNEALDIANAYAAKGDIDKIEEALEPYMKIRTKFMAIGSVVAWCYVTQLEKAVKEKTDIIIIEDGIKNYILIFGLRDEIESFYHICQKFYKELEMDLEILPKGSLKQWKPSAIAKSVLLLS